MKTKVFAVIISLFLALSLLSACGEKQPVSSIPDGTALDTDTITEKITEEITEEADLTAVNFYEETTLVSVEAEASSTTAVSEEKTAALLPSTVEEIVEYFNFCANEIKPSAKKVVKNYENRTVNEDKLVFPKSLASAASSLIDTFMKDDTEPIIYETREDITNEFLVPNRNYVSKLRPEWVESATCTDKGDRYIINIKLKDEKNSVSGKGVGSVCDVIETSEVSEKAPFVEKFTTEYYDCEVTATVDKASGRVVHMKYIVSVELALTVDMFGKHDVAAGMTFEKDYSIFY